MKKLKTELRLSVGTSGVDSPPLRKFRHSMGGMDNSVDNTFGGTYMARVNKGWDQELDEEEDEMSDEEVENLLKEFDIPFIDLDLGSIKDIGKTLYRGAKSATYSVPGIGDAISGISFVWQYFGPWGLRSQVRDFTENLSKLSQVDLGDDFLESESGPQTDSALDVRVNEAVLRLTNLKDYPELSVSYADIVSLQKDYDDINDKLRDVLMAFIGFADFAAGQSGLYLNLTLSVLEPEDFAMWIATKYADYIRKIEAAGGKSVIYSAAAKALKTAGKPLDYLGNLDLLMNVDKLNRLSAINSIFKEYKGVDTEEEKIAKGLKVNRGTSLARRIASGDYSDQLSKAGIDVKDLSPEEVEDKEKLYHKIFRRALSVLTEYNTSLAELYEEEDAEPSEDELEEDVDEASGAGGVAGVAVPIGKEADGSNSTPSILKKRAEDADIYRENIRYAQNWSSRTSGKIKFKK